VTGWVQSEYGGRVKQLESDITFHIGKQEAELTLRVNSAAFYGDLNQLKSLIRAGADPKNTDYDGRSPLVPAKCLFVNSTCHLQTAGNKLRSAQDCDAIRVFFAASRGFQRVRGRRAIPHQRRR